MTLVAKHLAEWVLHEGAKEEAIHEAALALGWQLPIEYVEFLSLRDGGEGFVEKNYLRMWGIEELIPFNRNYEVEKYAPGIILFGEDGGGAAYEFDSRKDGSPSLNCLISEWSCAMPGR